MSSDLQNKILQWEAKPPEEAWNKITASLDADDEYNNHHNIYQIPLSLLGLELLFEKAEEIEEEE